MKNIRDYIAQTERTYSYRIKTIVPLDQPKLTDIETAIMKYDPVDIASRKTIFQANPLDFVNVTTAAEVYIIDVTLGLPASILTLRQDICTALGAPDKFVVVRGANDPIENETQRIDAETMIRDEAEKAGLTPESLLDDPDYKEAQEYVASDLYGDAYNSKFLAHLKKISDEKKAAIAAAIPVPKSPMFNFLSPDPAAGENFNADIKTPEAPEGENPMDADRSIQGNYDADKKQYRRVFRTAQGKEKIITKDADGVRKGK